mmetsp:Transcript_76207/g.203757  ORF Transcript_76207/g.203757 Transcript_76207/m.203757 type:complete len:231 (-) Transcript_76207:707-1399(-)
MQPGPHRQVPTQQLLQPDQVNLPLCCLRPGLQVLVAHGVVFHGIPGNLFAAYSLIYGLVQFLDLLLVGHHKLLNFLLLLLDALLEGHDLLFDLGGLAGGLLELLFETLYLPRLLHPRRHLLLHLPLPRLRLLRPPALRLQLIRQRHHQLLVPRRLDSRRRILLRHGRRRRRLALALALAAGELGLELFDLSFELGDSGGEGSFGLGPACGCCLFFHHLPLEVVPAGGFRE